VPHKTCIVCGAPSRTYRCALHGGERRSLSTNARGYDAQHKRTRAALLPGAYGTPCPLCHQPMLPTQQLDLDHTISAVFGGVGDRIVHARCNRARGRGQGMAPPYA
jgi:hypothetical protein